MDTRQRHEIHQAMDAMRNSEYSAVATWGSDIASLTIIAELFHQQEAYCESELAVVTRDVRSEVKALGDKFRVVVKALHDTSSDGDTHTHTHTHPHKVT